VSSVTRQDMSPRRYSALRALNDPVLAQYIDAGDDASRAAALESLLVDHARPVISRVVGRYRDAEWRLLPQDVDDVIATVHLRLVRRLGSVLLFEDDAITRFDDYVATLTYHTIYDFLRRRFPERTRLKNRLRYLLTHDARFATWTSPRGIVCALSKWPDTTAFAESVPPEVTLGADVSQNPDRSSDAVASLLERVGTPLLLEAVLTWFADLWAVSERRVEIIDLRSADPTVNQLDAVDSRQQLAGVWDEIRELPARQRQALLLNLRDVSGGSMINTLLLLRVTTFDEVAAVLEMSAEELAEIWNELPVDDLRVAAMIGGTRQQVINLRKAARKRLARRMSVRNRPKQ
jgi:DNA-directed RNA polymerase specialized sigma24 family protein